MPDTTARAAVVRRAHGAKIKHVWDTSELTSTTCNVLTWRMHVHIDGMGHIIQCDIYVSS